MASVGSPRYRYETKKVIRGRESATIAKMQRDGWELDSQSAGRLQSELKFRRVAAPVPWRLIAAAAVAVVAIGVVAGVVASKSDDGEPSPPFNDSAGETTEPRNQTKPQPSKDPVEDPDPDTDEVLTVQSNADLRKLLRNGADPGVAPAFARQHEGQTIEFDGAVYNTAPHDGFETRFDFLILSGDFDPEAGGPGPSFQFRDVNFLDLNVVGRGSSVGTGDELHVVARVLGYEQSSELFLLEPVEIRLR